MVGEGQFFDTLGTGTVTRIPGGLNSLGPTKKAENNGKYMRLDFDSHPVFHGKVLANGTTLAHAAPTGGTGDENIMMYPEGSLEWHVLGTQTLLAALPTATGLNIAQDLTANDGAEYCSGILASNKLAFTVGTSAAFFARMRFTVADVSGSDECAFGFRKAEAYQATLDGYDAMACLNKISGNINIETITDNATNVTTDTTDDWADTETHEFAIYVSSAGVVTYKIDGRPPTTTAAFTFTDAEVVVPFFYFLHDATSPGAITLLTFECGLQ